MKVKALARGVYGNRLYELGEKFTLVDDEHLGSWMEPLEDADKKKYADKLANWKRSMRQPPPPNTPATTALLRDPPPPKKAEKKQ